MLGKRERSVYCRPLTLTGQDALRTTTIEGHPPLDVKPEACVGVALCSGGYPGHYETGKPITGWNEAARIPSVELFHAGTGRDGDRLVTAGGRVFVVTATAPTVIAALAPIAAKQFTAPV